MIHRLDKKEIVYPTFFFFGTPESIDFYLTKYNRHVLRFINDNRQQTDIFENLEQTIGNSINVYRKKLIFRTALRFNALNSLSGVPRFSKIPTNFKRINSRCTVPKCLLLLKELLAGPCHGCFVFHSAIC